MEIGHLLQKIKQEFPEISWESVRKTKENWDFDVVILDEKYVFRFASDEEGRKKLSREIKLLDYLKDKIAIQVPNYIFRSKSGEFAGYEMIQGGVLTEDEFRKLSVEGKEKIAKQMADFLNVLHGTPQETYEGFGENGKDNAGEIKSLEDRIRNDVFSKLSEQEVYDIERFFNRHKELSKNPYKKVLVHGDLTKENFIYAQGEIKGIIDFSDFSMDEPALDFKGCWVFGQDFVEMVYKNYQDKGDGLFLERSKLNFKIIGLYILDGAINYENCPFDFEKCHEKFRETFYI